MVYLFLFLMIFTNAFALNSVLTPVFVVSFILIFHFFCFCKKILKDKPPYLFFFWLLLTFSFVVMSNGEKCRNHWFLWTFPFFSYYFVLKNELYNLFTLEEIKHKVLKLITCVTVFSCAFCIFEFCCSNFWGIDLSFIPRGAVEDYTPFDGFFRARSFAEESGHFSFFVEIFGPLSIYWILQNARSLIKLPLVLVILLGILATMSGVGLLLMLVYLFLFTIFYVFRKESSLSAKFGVLSAILSIICLALIIYPEVFSTVWNLIALKMDSDNASHADRAGRFAAIDKLSGIAYLIGYGPAAFSTLNVDSFISLYLGILMNTGLFGLFLFGLFCLSKYKRVINIADKELSFALKWAFLFACLHLAFIDIIYVPWFWVLLSLIDVISYKERNLEISALPNL